MRVFRMMTVITLPLLALGCVVVDRTPSSVELNTRPARLSYALGMEMGGFLKGMPTTIQIDAFLAGVRDRYTGKARLTRDQANEAKMGLLKKMQAEQARMLEKSGGKNRKEGEAFLAKNKKRKGVVTTPSGLQYELLRQGDGPGPGPKDKVKVHYRGTLIDGTEFDSSYKGKKPQGVVMSLRRMIPGWVEGLQLMKTGSKYRFVIPPELAYGEQGAGGRVGPNSTLVFEVELLSVEK